MACETGSPRLSELNMELLLAQVMSKRGRWCFWAKVQESVDNSIPISYDAISKNWKEITNYHQLSLNYPQFLPIILNLPLVQLVSQGV